MVNLRSLNNNNFKNFRDLYRYNNEFNSLNEDFFKMYNFQNFINRYLLKKKVKLIQYDSKYIGYIWVDSFKRENCIVNSMSFLPDVNIEDIDFSLNSLFQNADNIMYICEESKYSTYILNNLGFKITMGAYELKRSLDSVEKLNFLNDPEISFHKFIKGTDEKLRCHIQNSIFESNSRVNLTQEDIILDELQDYYIDDGAVFIKKDNEYIGYGQIIKENEIAIVVNFGIIDEYRGMGYSKYLLNYLLNTAKALGYNGIKLRVDHENYKAINLYKSCGFEYKRKIHTWELKNKRQH